MKFQGHKETFEIPFPYLGIDTNVKNDLTKARYIQNMVIGDNKTGQVRYGTEFVTSHAFDVTRPFNDTVEVMNYFKTDGTTEKIIYDLYLTQIQHLDVVADVDVDQSISNPARSTITIDLTNYTADQKLYFNKIIFDEVYIFVRQNQSDGAYITNYNLSVDGNTLTFDLPFAPNFFETDLGDNTFALWIERGGIYRKGADDSYTLLVEDLDPNVVISSVTFENRLLIANGVDPVKVYDGTAITDLKAPVSIAAVGNITINVLNLVFDVLEDNAPELQRDLQIGNTLTLIRDDNDNATVSETRDITNIVFAAPVNNLVNITITLNIAPTAGTRQIIYQKLCPAFSYLAIAKKRIWALPEGRIYKDKFRSPELAMRAYYTSKVESFNSWFNERTNQIDFIGGEPNNGGLPDNWEAIKAFGDRVIFFGRDSMQIWKGFDPSLIEETLPDFFHEETITIGLYQKRLLVEAPSNLVFLSKIGYATARIDNLTQKVVVSYAFGTPIDHHLKNQLSVIENEKDYRSMTAFLYPYGRFMGFKIKYSCLIYQLNDAGAWLVFTGNFTAANSFCYDPTTKDLYLATTNGTLLKYTDKTDNSSFEDYGIGKISWIISYNWTYLGATWSNSYVYFVGRTLKPITIDCRFFVNKNESRSMTASMLISQEGALYDRAQFNNTRFFYTASNLFHKFIKFTADYVMLDISGLSNDLLIIDNLRLAGGKN